MELTGIMSEDKISVHCFNTYLQGGAAYGAINTFESIIKRHTNVDGRFFYMLDLSMGEKIKKLSTESYVQRHPLQLNSNLIYKITNSIKARSHYKKVCESLKGRDSIYEQFSPAKQYYRTPYSWFSGLLPQIIHLNWIAEWIDYESFFASIPNHIPIVWTLHDQNPMTAGCHYSWKCDKYLQKCTKCPQLGGSDKRDLAALNHIIKQKSLQHKNLHIVGDSTWITAEAQKSSILKTAQSFTTIHYSIDFETFKPNNDVWAERTKHDIPHDAFVLCFGAADFTNRRKGFPELMEALKIVKQHTNNIYCLVFGAGKISFDSESLPPIRFTGQLNAKELAKVYSASNLFLIPSLHEAFGLTAIEAMACGTPVIGFNTGGITDSVIEGTSGWLVQNGNSRQLAQKIIYLEQNRSDVEQISLSAINYASENFNKEKEVSRYMELYKRII